MISRFTGILGLVIFISLGALSQLALAKATPSGKGAKKETIKKTCSVKALRQKDCHLNNGAMKIQVWNDKIFLNDKINRDLKPLPLTGKDVEWQQINLLQLKDRYFLELYLWNEADPKTEVQSLYWFVLEIKGSQLLAKLNQLIQKRKILVGTKNFKYDAKKKSELFYKNNKIYFKLDQTEEVIE